MGRVYLKVRHELNVSLYSYALKKQILNAPSRLVSVRYGDRLCGRLWRFFDSIGVPIAHHEHLVLFTVGGMAVAIDLRLPLVQQERLKDVSPVFKIVGDNVDEIRGRHDVVYQFP